MDNDTRSPYLALMTKFDGYDDAALELLTGEDDPRVAILTVTGVVTDNSLPLADGLESVVRVDVFHRFNGEDVDGEITQADRTAGTWLLTTACDGDDVAFASMLTPAVLHLALNDNPSPDQYRVMTEFTVPVGAEHSHWKHLFEGGDGIKRALNDPLNPTPNMMLALMQPGKVIVFESWPEWGDADWFDREALTFARIGARLARQDHNRQRLVDSAVNADAFVAH